MPQQFTKLNRYHVPWYALVFNYLFGLILLLPFPGWQHMVGFLVTAFVLVYSIGPLALSRLRQLHPDKARSFNLPLQPLLAPMAFYICNLLLYWTGWSTISKLLGLILVGAMLLAISQSAGKRWLSWKDVKQANWIILYLIGVGVISYLGNFDGGRHLIQFGWDFLVIAVFSMSVYYYSLRRTDS